jgi:hypothetical protein
MPLTPRAALNLQRRLYEVWPERLAEALHIAEVAGPSDRLEDVLALIQEAEAAVRVAIAAARGTSNFQ